MTNREWVEGKTRPLGNHPTIYAINPSGRLVFQMPHDDLDLDLDVGLF